MPVPQPSVRLQPTPQPSFEASRVVPQQMNPGAEAAAALGSGLDRLGNTVLRVDQALSERLDLARGREADAKIADGYRGILRGVDKDGKPTGYQHLAGRSALDARESALKALDDHRRSILDSLTPSQRAIIADSEAARYQQARHAIDGHYAAELDGYEKSGLQTRIDQSLDAAVEGWFTQDPPSGPVPYDEMGDGRAPSQKAFDDNRTTARADLVELARRNGLHEDAVAQLLVKADDQLYGAIAERLRKQKGARVAAEFLDANADRFSREAMAKQRNAVRVAGVDEQAQALADELAEGGGDLLAQLDSLTEMQKLEREGKPGGVSIEVYDAARERVLQGDRARSVAKDALYKDSLQEAEEWAMQPGNKAAVLDPEIEDKLKRSGAMPAYRLWKELDGNLYTTRKGRDARLLDDSKLLESYPTEGALEVGLRTEMSPEDFEAITARWRRARGEALNPKDAIKLELRKQAENYLTTHGFYEGVSASQEKERSRQTELFHQAVTLEVNALAGKGEVTNAIQQQAIENIYRVGVVVDNKWVPSLFLTPEQRERAVTVSSYEAWKAGGGNPLSITFLKSGQTDSTVVRQPDGSVVDLRPYPGADELPTFERIVDRLRARNAAQGRHGAIVSENEVNREMENWMRERAVREADAKFIASNEFAARREAFLEGLPRLVEAAARDIVEARTRTLSAAARERSGGVAQVMAREEAERVILESRAEEARLYHVNEGQLRAAVTGRPAPEDYVDVTPAQAGRPPVITAGRRQALPPKPSYDAHIRTFAEDLKRSYKRASYTEPEGSSQK